MPAVPDANTLQTPPPDEEMAFDLDAIVVVTAWGDIGTVANATMITTASGQTVFVYGVEFDDPLERGDEVGDEILYGAGELQPYEPAEHPQPAE